MRARLRLPPAPSRPVVPIGKSSRTLSSNIVAEEGKPSKTSARLAAENLVQKKPRILCLHGFRTSAAILSQLIGRWPQTVLEKLDLDFLDGPSLAHGKSDVEGIFDPPYYEWYRSNEDFTEYINFEESVSYIEEHMINHGPFDGLLGFSQGALLSAAVPGMQAQGTAFTKVPRIKFVILISASKSGGYKLGQPKLAANAFSSNINCPSLHIIGEKDFLKPGGIALLESFVDPVAIHHSKGHIVPRLDEQGHEATMVAFIDKIQRMLSEGSKWYAKADL